ncbi:MAG: hypothetical protein AAFN92_11815 [Bacteroidota bacterium]
MNLARLFLCLLLVGSTAGLFAQGDLRGDLSFFQRKAATFERWLVHRNLSQYLRVTPPSVSADGRRVELVLELATADVGRADAIWRAMRISYQPGPGLTTLEEGLYATFIRYFEITPAQGSLQIMLRTDPATNYRNPCFHLWIEAPAGNVQTHNRLEQCKSAFLQVDLNLPPITLSPTAQAAVNVRGTSKWIFDNIIDFARRKYVREKPNCEQRFPQLVRVKDQGDFLEFYVTDLCQEVLDRERQSLWCDLVEWLGGTCNDTRRERLEFRVQLNRPDANRVQLAIELTGKFGSGVFMPRRSGWIDMDPDFEDDFLVPHARRFQEELVTYLTRP